MNLKEMIRMYSNGRGESVMWNSIGVVSDLVKEYLPEDAQSEMMKRIYYSMVGGHYNKEFAEEQISKMFYVDSGTGERHDAPYWNEDGISEVYRSIRGEIPSEYNLYDFEVAINMVKSDFCNLLKEWFPQASREELMERMVDLVVNYFNDDDCESREKIWNHFNK